jgi:hypothetical protein
MFLIMTFTYDLFKWILFIVSASSSMKAQAEIEKRN